MRKVYNRHDKPPQTLSPTERARRQYNKYIERGKAYERQYGDSLEEAVGDLFDYELDPELQAILESDSDEIALGESFFDLDDLSLSDEEDDDSESAIADSSDSSDFSLLQ